MLSKLINIIDKVAPIREVKAHCDVPCGIYDTSQAIIACLTVIRMTDLIIDHKEVKHSVEWHNEVSRYIAEKEKHAEMVKHEIRVIWGDFFKAPQFEKYPELHNLTHGIMMQASKARQQVSRDESVELLNKVNSFAEIFWKIKGVATKKAVSPYAPSMEVVYPQF